MNLWPSAQQTGALLTELTGRRFAQFCFVLVQIASYELQIDQSHGKNRLSHIINLIYYIDTSVLLENIPLVKFIKTTSGTRVVYFP